jgi:hypothetical protein
VEAIDAGSTSLKPFGDSECRARSLLALVARSGTATSIASHRLPWVDIRYRGIEGIPGQHAADEQHSRIAAEGELEVGTAPELAAELADGYDDAAEVEPDLSTVTFIDSTGLRILFGDVRTPG